MAKYIRAFSNEEEEAIERIINGCGYGFQIIGKGDLERELYLRLWCPGKYSNQIIDESGATRSVNDSRERYSLGALEIWLSPESLESWLKTMVTRIKSQADADLKAINCKAGIDE